MADPVRYEDLPTAYVFNASMSKQTLQVTHLPLQQALHSQLHQSLSTAVGSTNQASVAELNDTHRHAHAAVIYQTSNEAAAGRGHLTEWHDTAAQSSSSFRDNSRAADGTYNKATSSSESTARDNSVGAGVDVDVWTVKVGAKVDVKRTTDVRNANTAEDSGNSSMVQQDITDTDQEALTNSSLTDAGHKSFLSRQQENGSSSGADSSRTVHARQQQSHSDALHRHHSQLSVQGTRLLQHGGTYGRFDLPEVSRTVVRGFTLSVGDSVHNYPLQPGGIYIITPSRQGIGIEPVERAAEGTFRFAMAVLEGAGRLPPGLQQAAVAKLVAYLRREAAALENTDPLRLSSAEMEAILSVVDEDWAVAEEQRGRLSSVLRKLVPKSVEQVEEQASAAFAASLQAIQGGLTSEMQTLQSRMLTHTTELEQLRETVQQRDQALQVLAPQPGDVRLEVTGSARLPSGWLLCDGQDVPRATYKNLFMAIGVTQGRGNGRSTFNLPDMRHLQQQLGLQHVRAIIYAGANN